MNILVRGQRSIRHKRMKREWRGSRARSERGRTGGKSKSDFQKMTAFHDISLSLKSSDVMPANFECAEMNGC
jgi:hypothetical protein